MATSSKKLILITGASRGIGYSTVQTLLLNHPDYHILFAVRNLETGTAVLRKLLSLPNIQGTAEAIQLDVTDDESVDAAASYVQEKYGHLDILINNAGISSMGKGRDVARKIFEVNVFGFISVTEAFLRLLKASPSGDPRMILVSSSMGSLTYATTPGHALCFNFANEYRASKAAANMLMVQYRYAGLKVHSFDPGAVATYFGGIDDAFLEKKRERGAVEPEEAAGYLVDVVLGKRDGDAERSVNGKGVNPW